MALPWILKIAFRSKGLTQSDVRVPSSYFTALIRTFASTSCYAVGRKSLSEEERQRKYEEVKTRWRLRYQSDPDFREKQKQRVKDRNAKFKNQTQLSEEDRRKYEERKARAYEKWRFRYHSDPEFREKHKQRMRNICATPEYRKRWRERYGNDPQFREKNLRRYRERYANDPQFREQQRRKAAKQWLEPESAFEQDPEAYRLKKHQNAERARETYRERVEYRWIKLLRNRLRFTPRYCDEVVWALHKPVLYPAKTNHTCATCGHARYGGLKLWYVTRLSTLNWRKEADGDLTQVAT